MAYKKKILITGSSSGIGYSAILEMLKAGHEIIAPCRSEIRANQFYNNLKKDLSNNQEINLSKQLTLPIFDLSNLKEIDISASKILESTSYIDTLVLNAGLQYTGSIDPKWSDDGFELTFAVNHLGHQFLTQKIISLILKSQSPRVVITSSEVHNPECPGGRVGKPAYLGNLDGLKRGKGFKMIDGSDVFSADKAYKDSKLCNLLFAQILLKKLKLIREDISVIAWAPGLVIPKVKDGFFRYSRKNNEIGQRIFAIFARDILGITESVNNAGKILFDISTKDKFANNNFSYLSNRIIGYKKKLFGLTDISKEASDIDLANNLWKLCSDINKINSIIN